MSKVLILYYSTYGHIEKMAEAVAGWLLRAKRYPSPGAPAYRERLAADSCLFSRLRASAAALIAPITFNRFGLGAIESA
jgi:hypothetical protein